MSWEHLFSRCPVLPADASISLARYLHTLRETSNQITKEEKTDPDRALLLQIRVLQLICKTLPSHPGYRLPENRQLVHELRVLAHAGFAYLERRAEDNNNTKTSNKVKGRVYNKAVVPISLVELFQRIARDSVARGDVVVGILAGSEANDGMQFDVRALVIPAQNAGKIRYPADVEQLLRVKGLVCTGIIIDGVGDSLKAYEDSLDNITVRAKETIAVVPGDTTARTLVLSKRRWQETQHIDVNEALFKLYDLRPLAVARDDKTGSSSSSVS